jgi:diketogulonate reductase-like aldo/keto reductase
VNSSEGVYQSANGGQSSALAFKTGYRHIDSARAYRNEEGVAQAFRDSGLPRADVWLTTKIYGAEHETAKAEEALRTSTERLGGGAPWDLILLHDPTAGPEKRMQAWKVLVEASAYDEWQLS